MIPSHSINTLPNPYLDTNRIKEANSFKENEGLNQEQKILIKTTSGKNKSTEEEYIVGKQLGKGIYSQCFELRCVRTGKIYACKFFKKDKSQQNQEKKILSEIIILRKLNHPNIIKYRSHGENDHFYFILTDKCNQGNLRNVLRMKKRFTEIETKCIILQLSNALKYLHQKKIIHRDIKLDNIFLHDNKIQLGDFGFSTILRNNGDKAKSVCGTPNYIAPEILEKKPYDMMVDIWSLGVLTYTLIVGIPPFESKDTQQAYEKIKKCEYSIPKDLNISEEARDFIKRCLTLEPSQRITANELTSHPFFMTTPNIPDELPIELQSPLKQKVLTPEINSDEKRLNRKRPCTTPINSFIKTKLVNKKTKVEENNNGISDINNDIICINNHEKSSCTLALMRRNIFHIYNRIKDLAYSNICNKEVEQPSYIYNEHRYGHQWVSKWIDVTRDNIGFGYQLCNGSIGIHFNDKSRMYGNLRRDKIDVSYFCQSNENREYVTKTFDLIEAKKWTNLQMKRKLLIYQKLTSHLPPKLTSIGLSMVCELREEEDDDTTPLLFWHLFDDKTIVFIFENFTLQINFSDHTKLIMTFPYTNDFMDINKKPEMITYVNKKGKYETLCSSKISSKDLWKESNDKFKRAVNVMNFICNMKDDELCPLFQRKNTII